MSSKRRRSRHFSPQGEAVILQRHLADEVNVADLCEDYKLQPSVLYKWERHLLANAART